MDEGRPDDCETARERLHDWAAASMGQCKQASRRCAPVDELVHAVLQPGAHAGAGLERAGAVQTGPAMPGLRCGMDASLCLPNQASPTTAQVYFDRTRWSLLHSTLLFKRTSRRRHHTGRAARCRLPVPRCAHWSAAERTVKPAAGRTGGRLLLAALSPLPRFHPPSSRV